MVDKSNMAIIVAIGLVLALSTRDIITIRSNNENAKENSARAASGEINLSNEEKNEFGDIINEKKEDENENEFDSNNSELDDEESDTVKKIPPLKIKRNVQTLKFLFCYSCGYRNMFEQYSKLIRERYPDINIVGENYKPPNGRTFIAQFLGTFKLVVIGFILFGQSPFQYFNMNTPTIFTWATDNKLYSTLMIFFISNAIETQLISTGAFEIYLNDVPVWSKLQSDRMPHEKEIMQILDVNFNFDSAKKDAFGSGAENFNPNIH